MSMTVLSLIVFGSIGPLTTTAAPTGGTTGTPTILAAEAVAAAPDAPTTTDPTVISIAPRNGAQDVKTSASLAATFSRPMDPKTINESTVMLIGPSGSPVPVAITYSKGTDTVRLHPKGALEPATTYTVMVKGGDDGVKDLTGGNLDTADFKWQFTTQAKTGNGPPVEVTDVWPTGGASDVNHRSKAFIVFSVDMDPATINEDTIQLSRSQGPCVPYHVTYGHETQSAIIEPLEPLPSDTYTVTIKGGAKGVKDEKGNALSADETRSFTVP